MALLGCLLQVVALAEVALRLEAVAGGDGRLVREGEIWQVNAAGPVLAVPEGAVGEGDQVLEFEYFCVGGMPSFAVLPGPPFRAATARRLPAIPHAEVWSRYAAPLAGGGKALPAGWKRLRLDLPVPAGRRLQLRGLRLRPARDGEFATRSGTLVGAAEAGMLEAYLTNAFPAKVARVEVGAGHVRVAGEAGGVAGPLALAEIPMDVLLGGDGQWAERVPVTLAADGRFVVELPRRRLRGGRGYDRLLSRWQVVAERDGAWTALSHARYADAVVCRSPEMEEVRPKSKKGLGGWHLGPLKGELAELGITAVTVNVMIHSLVALEAEAGTVPFEWQGRTYHAREAALAGLDATFREAAEHGAVVSAILLVANPARGGDALVKRLGHPAAVADGTFAMPNVTSEEGIALYGAVLNLMAERWSRPDGKYGRVHHWIMHNEVDAGWVWTNAGRLPAVSYLDLYQRSMRMMDLIARQYDPHSRAFISLTHHWGSGGNPEWYGSKKLLDLLVRFTAAEGDFPWALAYHPYPENLFDPRTWEDRQAVFRFDSPKITPRNLEVLDAYMKRPEMRFQGRVRPVHLSENGFNSKDYSERSLEDQAAGMAYAWHKIAGLSAIESWQYHNWIDNRHEGGLRIGLRKFPDEPGDPFGKKPIWHVYRALGTGDQAAACAPYLKTIGMASWDEVVYGGEIR